MTPFYSDLSKCSSENRTWLEHFIKMTVGESGVILPKKNPEVWFKNRGLSEYFDEFTSKTSHLGSYSFGDKLKALIQGFWEEPPRCKNCGSAVPLLDQHPYTPRPFCSRACSSRYEGSKEKSRITCLKKYGVENASQAAIVKTKARNSCILKYGVENVSQSSEIKLLKQKTCIEHFGVPSHLMLVSDRKDLSHISDSTWSKINDQLWLKKECEIEKKSIEQIAHELGDVTPGPLFDRCKKWGINPQPRRASSIPEDIVVNYILSIKGDAEILRHTRGLLGNRQEIDIFVPQYKFGIEVNGLYWHSRAKNTYHQTKKLNAMANGIDLMMVTDHDIADSGRWDIIKSIIAARLGVVDRKIFARKTCVVEVTAREARQFYNENHLQGFASAEIHLALKSENEIVFMASFGKSRFDDKYDYELIRCSTKKRTIVSGGFEKIVKAFRLMRPGSIASYVDLHYFNGRAFSKWSFVRNTAPGYVWTNGTSKMSRYQTQKKNLRGVLGERYNPVLTETDNMMAAGFFKYHNCGNALYVLQ